mgnify:CR=1 FL=1
MVAEDATTYSIDELSERVAHLLQERGLKNSQQDNRVSAAPDRRTIRYYTSLGLLDRPTIKGRQARYSERHVLQILAIKALQSVSLPLSEIQSLLFGSSEEELENVIHSIQESNKVRKNLLNREESFRVTRLKEIEIEPGLTLVVEEEWVPELNKEKLFERIKHILDTLTAPGEKLDSIGGEFNGKKEDFG